MPFAGLRDDGVDRVGRQPAADAEDSGLRAGDAADDGVVLRGKGVERRVEPHVVGAELDGDERRVGRLDRAQLGQRPGRLGPAAGHQVERHAQLVRDQSGKGTILRRGKPAGADAVAQGDVDLALQALIVSSGVHAKHLAGSHHRGFCARLANSEQ